MCGILVVVNHHTGGNPETQSNTDIFLDDSSLFTSGQIKGTDRCVVRIGAEVSSRGLMTIFGTSPQLRAVAQSILDEVSESSSDEKCGRCADGNPCPDHDETVAVR